MATVSNKHQFIPSVKLEPVNPKYEVRPYVQGTFFLCFGGINTVYKKELVSYDRLEEIWYCTTCGQDETDPVHDLVVKLDRVT